MWKLDGTLASLNTPELSAALDLAQPHRGVKLLAVRRDDESHSHPAGEILQVHFPIRPGPADIQDSWVRMEDVVAIYSQTKIRQVRSEIYWRLVRPAPAALGIEMILSVQTDLLDASATTSTSSQLAVEEVIWWSDPQRIDSTRCIRSGDESIDAHRETGRGLFIFRPSGVSYSYLEMMHPADFFSATLHWHGAVAVLHWQLFPESLEKGVIRRARSRGLFVPRSDDVSNAARLYTEFSSSPPPLTT